jgi:hypothetical protein
MRRVTRLSFGNSSHAKLNLIYFNVTNINPAKKREVGGCGLLAIVITTFKTNSGDNQSTSSIIAIFENDVMFRLF